MTELTRLPRPIGRSLTLDELLEWLKALYPWDRHFAAMELGTYNDPRAVEPLIEALDDSVPYVRSAAADSLGRLGRIPKVRPVARQAVKRLVAMLEDEDEEVIGSAVYALGELGDSSIAPKLLPFLEHPNSPHVKIRNVAILALRTLRHEPAIPHLQHLLRDPELAVRGDALLALFSMRDVNTNVEKILRSLVDDPDPFLRQEVRPMLEVIDREKRPE